MGQKIIHLDIERTETMNQLFKVEKKIRNNMQDIDSLLMSTIKEVESFKKQREQGSEHIRKEDSMIKSSLNVLIEVNNPISFLKYLNNFFLLGI